MVRNEYGKPYADQPQDCFHEPERLRRLTIVPNVGVELVACKGRVALVSANTSSSFDE
jgi:hypothetical protein